MQQGPRTWRIHIPDGEALLRGFRTVENRPDPVFVAQRRDATLTSHRR
jgi:hypothetical protein